MKSKAMLTDYFKAIIEQEDERELRSQLSLIRFLSVAAFQADGGLRQQALAGPGSGYGAAAQDVAGWIGYMPERVRSLPSMTWGRIHSPLDALDLSSEAERSQKVGAD